MTDSKKIDWIDCECGWRYMAGRKCENAAHDGNVAMKRAADKKAKRPSAKSVKRTSGEKLHNDVCNTFASLLAQAREKLPWDEHRTRVLILVSTDHADNGSAPEALAIFASSPDHSRCIVERAANMMDTPYVPEFPIVVTRH